jgi:hypothetical protein
MYSPFQFLILTKLCIISPTVITLLSPEEDNRLVIETLKNKYFFPIIHKNPFI